MHATGYHKTLHSYRRWVRRGSDPTVIDEPTENGRAKLNKRLLAGFSHDVANRQNPAGSLPDGSISGKRQTLVEADVDGATDDRRILVGNRHRKNAVGNGSFLKSVARNLSGS